jgi:hypothetical protein
MKIKNIILGFIIFMVLFNVISIVNAASSCNSALTGDGTITIPTDCYTVSPLQLRVNLSNSGTYKATTFQCWNGTTWKELVDNSYNTCAPSACTGSACPSLYEESLYLYDINRQNTSIVTTINTSYSTLLVDGDYYYSTTIYDKAGNSFYYDPNVSIDTTFPTLVFNNTETSSSIIMRVVANDTHINNSNIYMRLYDINGTLLNNIQGTFYNFSNMTGGTYYYNASATDTAGNTYNTITYTTYKSGGFALQQYNTTFPYKNNAVISNNILNVSFTSTDSLYNYTIFNISRLDGTKMFPGKICYQESPNVTNQTGIDGNCGLNYSGSSTSDMSFYDMNYLQTPSGNLQPAWNFVYANDGDWGTVAKYFLLDNRLTNNTNPSINYFYENYSFPSQQIYSATIRYNLQSAYGRTIEYMNNSGQWELLSPVYAGTGEVSVPVLPTNKILQIRINAIHHNSGVSDWIEGMYETAIKWTLTESYLQNTTSSTSISYNLPEGKYYYSYTIYNKAGDYQFFDPNITIDTTNPTIQFNNGTSLNGSVIITNTGIIANISANDTNYYYSIVNLYNSTSLYNSVALLSNCSQEFANQTANCSLVGNGSYLVQPSYVYVNYTKPPAANNNSIWYVKHGDSSRPAYNVNIPTICWNANPTTLSLRMFSQYSGPTTSYGQCYNGTGWQTITNVYNTIVGGGSNAGNESMLIDGDYNTGAAYCNVCGSPSWNVNPIVGNFNDAYWYEEAMIWNLNSSYAFKNLPNDNYYFNATAYDLAGNMGFTNTINIIPDTVYPNINYNSGTINLNNNQQVISRDRYNITLNITYSDTNLYAAEINISCNQSGQIYYWSVLNINTTSYNKYDTFNITNIPYQQCQFYTATSDSHTAIEIPEYDSAVLENGLSFLTENDNVVQVITDEPVNNIQDVSTQKLKDRQTFSFDFINNDNTRTFRLLSNNIINYLPESEYPAHFVIWNPEEHRGNWVDFADKLNVGDTYNVEKINDYEYTITITTPVATDKMEFNSIGGTLFTMLNSTFFIGGSIYVTGITPYDNATFSGYTYTVNQLNGYPVDGRTVTSGTASTVIENLTNATYNISFSHPQYFNRSYLVNIINNSIYQNYSTYQAQANFNFLVFAKEIYLTNVTYTLKDINTNATITGNTGNNTLLTFNLDASNYTLNYSSPGNDPGVYNFVLNYQQVLNYTIPVSYIAIFKLYDERTLGVFNLSGATRVTFQLYCPGTTYYTTVVSTNFSVPINCDYTSFKFQLDYGTGGYYRSFILTPDQTNNVPIYLIDALTTTYIYNGLIADDLLKIYVNPRIYVYKNIGNATAQITANYVDISQKVGAYLIENNEYTIVIKSDNLPDYSVGIYAADTSGTVSIKLYDMSLYYQVDERNPTGFAAHIDNSTGDHLVLAEYIDTQAHTQSVIFNTYAGSTLVSTQSLPATSSAVFTTNVSGYYNNNTPTASLYGEFIITRSTTGVTQQKSLLAEATGINLGIWDYVSHDFVNWVLIILLGVLAVIGTMQTANYVAIALIFIAALFVMFGWLGISASVLAIAAFVALVSLLKEGERNS